MKAAPRSEADIVAVTFRVFGEPIPQGSARVVSIPGSKFSQIVTDNPRLKAWRRKVADAAALELLPDLGYPLIGPVDVRARFALPAPKAMSRARRLSTRPFHLPDLDKLQRAIGDALKGLAYKDDGQIVHWDADKVYAVEDSQVGVLLRVGPHVDHF